MNNLAMLASVAARAPSTPVVIGRGWSHLELGAANYGPVSWDHDDTQNPRFSPLFITIDELIQSRGANGVIFLNDLDINSCNFVAAKVRAYIKNKYPEANIRVEPIAKNYHSLDIPTDFGMQEVDSIHLKNPAPEQITNDLLEKDGIQAWSDNFWLHRLVKHSKSGVTIFTNFDSAMNKAMTIFNQLNPRSDVTCVKSALTYPHFRYINNFFQPEEASWHANFTTLFSSEKAKKFEPDAYTFSKQ